MSKFSCWEVCVYVLLLLFFKDCQVLSTERVLTVMNGISQFLQHHVQRGVLWQFDHEHTGLDTDVS